MLDKKYYEGYEGEEEVKIWCESGGNENGFLVWNGFFDTILEGCFKPEFQKGGMLECYYNHDDFYDGKWEMKYPRIVLDELKTFDENALNTENQEIIRIAKEIIGQLISLIDAAISKKEKVYIEYE